VRGRIQDTESFWAAGAGGVELAKVPDTRGHPKWHWLNFGRDHRFSSVQVLKVCTDFLTISTHIPSICWNI